MRQKNGKVYSLVFAAYACTSIVAYSLSCYSSIEGVNIVFVVADVIVVLVDFVSRFAGCLVLSFVIYLCLYL